MRTQPCSGGSLIVFGRDDDPALPIACRPGRRPGFHQIIAPLWAAELGGGVRPGSAISVDGMLRALRCAAVDARIVVRVSDELRPTFMSTLTRFSSSQAVVWWQGDRYLIDTDQAACLERSGLALSSERRLSDMCAAPQGLDWSFQSYAVVPRGAVKAGASGLIDTADAVALGSRARPTAPPTLPSEPARSYAAFTRAAMPSAGSGRGVPGVEMTSDEAAQIGLKIGDPVMVQRSLASRSGPSRLCLPVTIRESSAGSDTPATRGTPHVHVDQVVRLAVGVGVNEHIDVIPLGHPGTSSQQNDDASRKATFARYFARLWRGVCGFFFPTVSIVARVQPSELTLTEQRACLLTPLAIDAMGISSGDEIVVRSAHWKTTGAGVRVPVTSKKKIKAYASASDVVERRLQSYGGNRSAPLPSEEEALLTPQALPWIWLDDYTRKELGLTGKLSAVMVQPSRTFIFLDHLREIAVASVIGGLTLATKYDGAAQWYWAGGSLVFALVLVAIRVRSKLR